MSHPEVKPSGGCNMIDAQSHTFIKSNWVKYEIQFVSLGDHLQFVSYAQDLLINVIKVAERKSNV